jgi:hypothetical protein
MRSHAEAAWTGNLTIPGKIQTIVVVQPIGRILEGYLSLVWPVESLRRLIQLAIMRHVGKLFIAFRISRAEPNSSNMYEFAGLPRERYGRTFTGIGCDPATRFARVVLDSLSSICFKVLGGRKGPVLCLGGLCRGFSRVPGLLYSSREERYRPICSLPPCRKRPRHPRSNSGWPSTYSTGSDVMCQFCLFMLDCRLPYE